jgi:hypothetical protein
MWAFTRLPEFYKAYRSADVSWSPDDLPANLHFPEGLLISFLLVTPFWATVGLLLHSFIK